jgi:hypothetical protein
MAKSPEQVSETKDVEGEDGDEDRVEDSLPGLGATGCVVLVRQLSAEGLVLRYFEDVCCVGIVPEQKVASVSLR